MISGKTAMRRMLLLLFTLSITWALQGCQSDNFIQPHPPEPTFEPVFPPTTPLKFSPEKLPDARVGEAYSVIITISGNVTPAFVAWIDSGALPPEVVLQEVKTDNIVEISGTPKEPGEYTFTLGVGCRGTMAPGQQDLHEYTLVVKK